MYNKHLPTFVLQKMFPSTFKRPQSLKTLKTENSHFKHYLNSFNLRLKRVANRAHPVDRDTVTGGVPDTASHTKYSHRDGYIWHFKIYMNL